MNTLDFYTEKGRKEGIKLTEEKKNYEFVKNLLLLTDCTVPKIASLVNESEDFVQKVKDSL